MKGMSMSKNITLTESQYLRLLELISALEEQAVLFSWTSLQYGTTLEIIATGLKDILEGNKLIDDLLEEVDQTLTDRPHARAAAS
jgi:hypothetical protein